MLFVIFVNKYYLPGLYALLQSIVDNGMIPRTERFLILYEGDLSLRHQMRIKMFGFHTEFMKIKELGKIVAPLNEKGRFEIALDKILIFNIPYKGLICFIDADMLCLGSIKDIKNLNHFSAAPNFGRRLTFINGRKMFNTGLMVIRPSASLFNEILDYISQYQRNYDYGDQGILNYFFYERKEEEIKLLDQEWNMLKRIKVHHPQLFNINNIKFLHYVGMKPWQIPLWHREEKGYLSLNLLWWKYYIRSLLFYYNI